MANFPTNPSVGDLFETKHDTLRWNGSAWEALGRILTHREKSDSPYSSISVKESGGVLDTEDTSTVLLIGESTVEGQAKAAHSSDANTVFLSGETAIPGVVESTSDAATSLLMTGERDASLYKMRCGLSSDMDLTQGYHFDGTGDYLSITNSSDFNFSSGDFTIEGWIYANTTSLYLAGYTEGSSDSTAAWTLSSTGFYIYGVNTNLAHTAITNQWYHLAVSRSGSTIKLFINGEEKASSTASTIRNLSSPLLEIGRRPNVTSYNFNGFISDFKISKGIARYTADFATIVTTKDSSHKLILDGETTDSSDSAHTVSFNGNASETTKRSDRSLYFDGSGDYVDLQSTSNFAFGTDDFTIETWFRYETADSFPYLFDFRDAGTNGAFPACYLRSDDGYKPVYYVDGAQKIRSSVALSIDTWYHLAISRISGTTTMYLDGASVGSFTDSYDYADAPLRLGDYSNGGYELTGFLDDFKVSTTGRYTGAFDLDLVYNISDQSSSSHSLTASGNAAASTTQKKFGTHSMYFDGSGDDWIDIASSSDFAFGTGDFTIEFWFIYDSADYYPYLLDGTVSGIGAAVPSIFLESPDSYKPVYWVSGAQRIRSSVGTSVDTWYHLAIERNGDTTTMYLDGTSVGSFTDSISYVTCPLRIGDYSNNGGYGISGYIDELRISDTARYASAFNLEDVTTAVDKKGTHTVSHAGDALINSSGTSEETKFGGYAVKLDGTGDYLSIASHSDFAFGTDDFTIETWFKYDSANSFPYILDGRTSNSNGDFPTVYLHSSDSYKPVYFVNGAQKIRSSAGLTINTWYHFAIVRSSGTTTMYLDGTSVGSFSDSIDYVACPLRIGDQSSGGAALSGCMDEFRISTSARYTEAFTPQLAEHDLVDVKGWGSPVLGSGEKALFVNNNGLVMKSSDGTLTKLDTITVQSGRLTVGNTPASNSEPTLYTKADGLYYRDPSGVETKIS